MHLTKKTLTLKAWQEQRFELLVLFSVVAHLGDKNYVELQACFGANYHEC